jgi:hypothetical protein
MLRTTSGIRRPMIYTMLLLSAGLLTATLSASRISVLEAAVAGSLMIIAGALLIPRSSQDGGSQPAMGAFIGTQVAMLGSAAFGLSLVLRHRHDGMSWLVGVVILAWTVVVETLLMIIRKGLYGHK